MQNLLNKLDQPEHALALLNRIDGLLAKINKEPAPGVPQPLLKFMEVCGTHTMAISRTGLRGLLAGKIDLLSGPGCPVCVTSDPDIDLMIGIAGKEGVITATFGDMMRVPGSQGSLNQAQSGGADVRVVYSPLDAVALAQENSDRQVVFVGVGFETTTPTVALALKRAEALDLDNFSVFVNHKLTPPAVKALIQSGDVDIDGFICPGHVSAVLGARGFAFLPEEFMLPAVVAGFDAVDILLGIVSLLEQLASGKPLMDNKYRRVVKPEGNTAAQRLVDTYFRVASARWRGLGVIPESGLELRDAYRRFDARDRLQLGCDPDLGGETKGSEKPDDTSPGCSCGEILRGMAKPHQCKLFGTACTPERPIGPCMVSSEGACAAHYLYGSSDGDTDQIGDADRSRQYESTNNVEL